MPSKTPKQARFMAAACRGKTKKKISRKVACEFMRHDQKRRGHASEMRRKKR